MNIEEYYERLFQDIKAESASESAQIEDVEAIPVEDAETVEFVEDAIVNDDPEKQTKVKKAMAAALVAAKAEGVVNGKELETPEEIAAVADTSFDRLKLARDVATGELTPEQASDILIDHAAARVAAVAPQVVDTFINTGFVAAKAVAATYCPPLVPVISVIETFKPLIKEQTREFVQKGIKKVAEVSKKIVHKTIEVVKEKSKNLLNRLAKFIFS